VAAPLRSAEYAHRPWSTAALRTGYDEEVPVRAVRWGLVKTLKLQRPLGVDCRFGGAAVGLWGGEVGRVGSQGPTRMAGSGGVCVGGGSQNKNNTPGLGQEDVAWV